MPTFGSLFAGIGGIDLGLERAGWTGRWQVEYEPFCQRVLAKHWPDVPRAGDIRDTHAVWDCPVADADDGGRDGRSGEQRTAGRGEPADGRGCASCLTPVDLIAGGFPCQPFSVAGKRLGKADERWLWPEFARTIRALRPRYVLVENVPGLLAGHGGMGAVLGDLAELGYDAEWDSIPAAAVGAPHLRYRVWIVGTQQRRDVADASSRRGQGDGLRAGRNVTRARGAHDVANPDVEGLEGRSVQPERASEQPAWSGGLADADEGGWNGWSGVFGEGGGRQPADGGWWLTEPDVGRVAHGVPARVDRLRALGNAVVPQVVEAIGRRILEAEGLT